MAREGVPTSGRERPRVTTQHDQPTLEEFLKWPDQKPHLEFIRGEVRTKAMPDAYHSCLQTELSTALNLWSRRPRIGWTLTEQRCILETGGESSTLLPDVAWWSVAQLPFLPDGPVRTPPILAIEILSPDDRYGDIQDKVVLYLEACVAVVWVVDPRSRNVTVYRADRGPQVLSPPSELKSEALPGLIVSLQELFAVLVQDPDQPPRIQE